MRAIKYQIWVIGHFVCFFMTKKLVFIELHWRVNKGLLLRGGKSSSLKIRRISLIKATRSAFKIEMIFEDGMARRDSRHCPEFRNSRSSSEFSISGPLCFKAEE